MTEIRHGQVVAGHLGGFVPGGDPNTTYPNLWRWFVDDLGVRAVIDVGCGDGATIDHFDQLFDERGRHDPTVRYGFAVGVDGIPSDDLRITTWDYTLGPYTPPLWRFDLAWSCEFVEHVAAEHVPNYMATFSTARMVAMTHALPGQPGHHHVNCQPPDYWIEWFDRYGFTLDPFLTAQARAIAATDGCEHPYFVETGMIFTTTPKEDTA